jgi:hypothetical protein
MANHALMTLLAWPYAGRVRLPRGLAARLNAAGLLPTTDTPHRHRHRQDGQRPVVLAGDSDSGPILAGAPAHHGSACAVLIAGMAAAGLHVYVGRRPAGGYCAVWDYHPPGETTTPVRHRCCARDRHPTPPRAGAAPARPPNASSTAGGG